MLMGYDPSEHIGSPLITTNPQVTFAYTKHLWSSGQTTYAYQQLKRFFHDFTQQGNNEDVTQNERRRLLARFVFFY